jgi:hypothetical protein
MHTHKTLQTTVGLDPVHAQRLRDVAAREGKTPRAWLEAKLSHAFNAENATELVFYLVGVESRDNKHLNAYAKVRDSDPDTQLDLLLGEAVEGLP